ncbi:hypothetical protein RBB77_21895 [Tunturibacter psychrotolerans]|uniref:SDR family NAD(P)-dependent oxidoreductase n=1 Tax=Tunturiibacter psychrotolerans TaxID=3069686 RepID=A0AAU7ZXB5_9BACT
MGSTSTRGGTPPYLAPYFAAKAGMDALAVSYAGELARWNIETSIIVPGAYTSGTNHFAHAGHPEDQARLAEYENGPTTGLDREIMTGLQSVSPAGADVIEVAKAVVQVVDLPFGTRPSAYISTPRMTALTSSTPLPTGFAWSSFTTSA